MTSALAMPTTGLLRCTPPVEPSPGADATTERVDPDSYVLELKLKPRVPTPNRTIEELAKVNPKLPELLPALTTMLPVEPVSPLFAALQHTSFDALGRGPSTAR